MYPGPPADAGPCAPSAVVRRGRVGPGADAAARGGIPAVQRGLPTVRGPTVDHSRIPPHRAAPRASKATRRGGPCPGDPRCRPAPPRPRRDATLPRRPARSRANAGPQRAAEAAIRPCSEDPRGLSLTPDRPAQPKPRAAISGWTSPPCPAVTTPRRRPGDGAPRCRSRGHHPTSRPGRRPTGTSRTGRARRRSTRGGSRSSG